MVCVISEPLRKCASRCWVSLQRIIVDADGVLLVKRC